jgi:hypothetical protein
MNTIFDTFKSVTRFDIETYFNKFSTFVLSDYQRIVDYYQRGGEISSTVLTNLDNLIDDMLQLTDLFSLYTERLSSGTAEIWELLDFFETTKVTLLTVKNSSRWMRSTKNVLRSDAVDQDYILRQGQNLEQLAGELGYSDINNDWKNIAINNDVEEEDYSFEGGTKLKISFINQLNYTVDSVIDSISGEKLYGLDIDRYFIFENNDLRTLGYKDTILQQTEILVGLVKGSVPEFPQDGISKDLISTNVNAIQYPAILRQQAAVFEKDDRYKSIMVNSLKTDVDSLTIDLQITTKLNETLGQLLVLQS